jgi:hypothetical protein
MDLMSRVVPLNSVELSVAFSFAGFRLLDRERGGRNSRDGGLFSECAD